jgi:CheY-like chemotaxis protein
MPGMSGYEVTRAIRGFEEIAEVPIVGASANNDDATRMRAFEAGMTDFVPKPWADSDIDRPLQRISSAGRKTSLSTSTNNGNFL